MNLISCKIFPTTGEAWLAWRVGGVRKTIVREGSTENDPKDVLFSENRANHRRSLPPKWPEETSMSPRQWNPASFFLACCFLPVAAVKSGPVSQPLGVMTCLLSVPSSVAFSDFVGQSRSTHQMLICISPGHFELPSTTLSARKPRKPYEGESGHPFLRISLAHFGVLAGSRPLVKLTFA